MRGFLISFFFFFNDTATTEIYTLSLHDALPISRLLPEADTVLYFNLRPVRPATNFGRKQIGDRKSTRLNSSHLVISYAVFCLKKKKKKRDFDIFEHCLECSLPLGCVPLLTPVRR